MSSVMGRGIQFLLFLVLAVPLVFGTHLLFPFVAYRTYFFFFVVSSALVLFVSQYGARWMAWFKTNPILRALGIFLVAVALSDAVGVNPIRSFWGNYERMIGLLLLVHLVAYVVMLINVFPDPKRYRRVVEGSVISAVLVTVYGLLQSWGIAFQIKHIDERLFSTIGNPGFLAGFLLLNLGFACYLFCTEASQRRWFWCGTLGLLLYALLQTATRGALIGLGAAGAVLVGYWAVCPVPLAGADAKTIRLVSRIILGLLVAGAGIFFLFQKTFATSSFLPLQRLAGISFSDVTTQSRLVVWRIGWQAFLDHPIFGWGDNAIAVALDRHYDPSLSELWFDSTHNVFLDRLVANGAVGLLAYLFLIWTILGTLQRIAKTDRMSGSILLALFVAYGVQSLFLFDTLVVLLPLFIAIGLVMVLQAPARIVPAKKNSVVAFVVGATVLILGLYHVRSIQTLAAATDGYRAITRLHDIPTALLDFANAERLAYVGQGNIASIIRDASVFVLNQPGVFPNEQIPALLDTMKHSYEIAETTEGQYAKWYVDPAKVYLEIANPHNPYLSVAGERIAQARRISPRRIDLWYVDAQIALQSGDTAGAKRILEDAKGLFPAQAVEVDIRLGKLATLIESSR